MKYSQQIGIVAALLVMAGCYLPWVNIPTLTETITGMSAIGTNFGRPGKLHLILCTIAIILFLVPKVWAKRLNWIFCMIGFAWALRNILLFTKCEIGTCPELRLGLPIVLVSSLIMVAASLLPDLKLKPKNKKA